MFLPNYTSCQAFLYGRLMLLKIRLFPNNIFIDKKGMVRKIHTGFYGPGTGMYYTNYVRETEALLDGLLNE